MKLARGPVGQVASTLVSCVIFLVVASTPAVGQERDTIPVRDTLNVPSDTILPVDTIGRTGPWGAFWRSLFVPGWGQSKLNRHVTGALFVVWEGVTLTMTLKANQQLQYLEAVGSPSAEGKRQEREDWLTLWIFNHVFAAAEAFVAAHLQDFPDDLEVRAIPGGIGVRLPIP